MVSESEKHCKRSRSSIRKPDFIAAIHLNLLGTSKRWPGGAVKSSPLLGSLIVLGDPFRTWQSYAL